jgi:NAD(P)-dependent dehydrogenase (short-subunit alcohol dehydrogenase family)
MAGLDGKVALVTGGGTGIGAAIAETFSGAGASVAVTGRRPAPLAQTVQRVTESGGLALAVCADVTDLAAMSGAVEETLDRFDHLDIVVANAGIQPRQRPVLDYPPEDWHRVVDVNLTGVWNTAKACVPALIRGGGGSAGVIGSGDGTGEHRRRECLRRSQGRCQRADAGASGRTAPVRHRGERADSRPDPHPWDGRRG